MQDLIQQVQLWLFTIGAPAWLQRPGSWVALGCGLLALVLVIRMILKRTKQVAVERGLEPEAGGVFGSLTPALAAQIPGSEKERTEFAAMLRQAGFYSRTAMASVYAYRFLLLVFPLVCAGLIAIFSPRSQTFRILFVGAFIAIALSIIPRLYIFFRRRKRLTEINNGLADMLDMLGMCLSGGMPLSASLDHVAKNLTNYPALADELLIMKRQAEVSSLKHALADFANRLDTPEVRQVASLLSRGDQLGSSISRNLLDQADHFRTARRQMATMQANRTPVFLTFPLMFCFAPAVLILLMSPSFMQLSEFLSPSNTRNPLANNQSISTDRIVETLESLDQSIPQNTSPAGRPSLAPPAGPPTR